MSDLLHAANAPYGTLNVPPLRPPSPFDVVTAQASHEDDWSRFPAGWPHLVVLAESDEGLVYGTRMRHLDGKLAQVGMTCTNIMEAKLRLEYLYVELALAARVCGGFYVEEHVQQCRLRLFDLRANAANNRAQDFGQSPHQQLACVPKESLFEFTYPLFYPHVVKERAGEEYYFLGRRNEFGVVPFDPYSLLGWEDTAEAATNLAIRSLYKWTKYRQNVIQDAFDIHADACERRGYDFVESDLDLSVMDEGDPYEYFYMQRTA